MLDAGTLESLEAGMILELEIATCLVQTHLFNGAPRQMSDMDIIKQAMKILNNTIDHLNNPELAKAWLKLRELLRSKGVAIVVTTQLQTISGQN